MAEDTCSLWHQLHQTDGTLVRNDSMVEAALDECNASQHTPIEVKFLGFPLEDIVIGRDGTILHLETADDQGTLVLRLFLATGDDGVVRGLVIELFGRNRVDLISQRIRHIS